MSCQHWPIFPFTIGRRKVWATSRRPITSRAAAFTAGDQKEEHSQPIENKEYERAEDKQILVGQRTMSIDGNWKTAGVTLASIQLKKLIGKHLV